MITIVGIFVITTVGSMRARSLSVVGNFQVTISNVVYSLCHQRSTEIMILTSEGEDGRCHGDQSEGSFKVSGEGTVPNT